MTHAPTSQLLKEPAGFASRLAELKTTLARIAAELTPAVFASGLAAEDMVLTDLILKNKLQIEIFSLDTNRLPAETVDVIDQVNKIYGYQIKLFYPNPAAVSDYINTKGLNGFYESVELRKECCHIRKVEPLKRALAGNKAWITGQRRTQSSTRANLHLQEHDEAHHLEKFNPLVNWTEEDVWYYIRLYSVPYNALHDTGYPSIGCAPCTRAVQPGEDIRAGRWWWESPESKECGLHVIDGKLVRIKNE